MVMWPARIRGAKRRGAEQTGVLQTQPPTETLAGQLAELPTTTQPCNGHPFNMATLPPSSTCNCKRPS
eukprot:1268531-Lingulodinium_polyedra.AAC.1